jgi:propanediol dehydratase large subunit
MKVRATVVSLALLCVIEAIAGTPHQFQAGKLLDVGSDERAVEGTTIIHAVYHVQVGDLIISARGERVRRHGGDHAHGLVVGDPVQVAIDGDDLILQRPDGKEIKAKIIRRQRAENK